MIICFACSEGGLQYTHSIFFPFYLVLNGFPKYLHFVQMQLWPSRKWGMKNWRRSQNANCIHTKKTSDKLSSWPTASQNLSHISENSITNSLNNKSTTIIFSLLLLLVLWLSWSITQILWEIFSFLDYETRSILGKWLKLS